MSILNDMIETALWSTLDYDAGDESDDCLDAKYCIGDISEEFKAECQRIIDEFMPLAEKYLTEEELENSPIGHDLWLTIEGHGAGFWDGDYEQGEELTTLCRKYHSLGEKLNESIKR